MKLTWSLNEIWGKPPRKEMSPWLQSTSSLFALSEAKFEDNCTGQGVVSEQRSVTVLEGFICSLKKLEEHNA